MKLTYPIAISVVLAPLSDAAMKKALIVDGQNNHAWRETMPVLMKALEQTGLVHS
jgi:hypothetical protein